jgi:transcriptional regulator with XRE-family HTH domain
MATTLVPVDSREVVRCFHCLLVQFLPFSNNCRRCHTSLDEPEPILAPPMMPVPVASTGRGRGHKFLNLSATVRDLRLRNGLSQRELAGRMHVPRTYVSKIENEKATPTLLTLEKLALALSVTAVELIAPGEVSRREAADELLRLPFIRALLPFVSRLTPLEMKCILAQVQDLIEQRRRRSLDYYTPWRQ